MSKLRMIALAAVASLAVLALGAGSAAAQAPAQAAPLTKKVTMTGTKGFAGTFTIDRFARRAGKTVAIGTVRGTLRGKRVTKRDVAIPVAVARGAQGSQIPPTPGACQILNLTIQPIDLNLLGLRVRTSRIDLRIEGVPGAGNLLGNLLCGITGILDPAAVTPSQLTALLNAILALVPAR